MPSSISFNVIKLYRFPYSCYALKVQYLLDKLNLEYETIDVPYTDRTELVEVTGGRVVVPAIAVGDRVIVESRNICEYLLDLTPNELVPEGQEAVIWAYGDWCDSTVEDVLFRIATPGIAEKFSTVFEKALFAYVKERRFGAGCVELWRNTQPQLITKAKDLLQKTIQSIAINGYVVGKSITYADITLLGHLAMVEYANPELIPQIDDALPDYMTRVRAA
ncbi:MAG: glutathione S-transferase [Cyanobacteria bacterium J06626_14]